LTRAFRVVDTCILRQQLRRDALLLLRGACRWPKGFWLDPVLVVHALEQRLCRAAALQLRECANLLRQRQRLAQELERRKGWPERDVVHLRGALDGVRHRLRTMLMTEAEREALRYSTWVLGRVLEGDAEELHKAARKDLEAGRPPLGVRDPRLQRRLRKCAKLGKPESVLKALLDAWARGLGVKAKRSGGKGSRPPMWQHLIVGELLRQPKGLLYPSRYYAKVARKFGLSEETVREYYAQWLHRTDWQHRVRELRALIRKAKWRVRWRTEYRETRREKRLLDRARAFQAYYGDRPAPDVELQLTIEQIKKTAPPKIARLIEKGRADPESLTEQERALLRDYFEALGIDLRY